MISVISVNVKEEVLKKRSRQRLRLGNPEVAKKVSEIIAGVTARGLTALLSYIQEHDGFAINADQLWVTAAEIDRAHAQTRPEDLVALRMAIKLISAYHARQLPQGWESGVLGSSTVGWRYNPIDRVGIYVPGGRAIYPSSLLMNVIPARLAGVAELVVATPPAPDGSIHPFLLATLKELGIPTALKAGGAHAVAALAFGFHGFAPVDKIVGPGNAWVTEAKKQVFGVVAIDKLAGPSDVTVLADHSADPQRVAQELLAQAEHDPDSEVFLVTTEPALPPKVFAVLAAELETLPRADIIRQVFRQSAVFVVSNMNEAYETINALAPEHLQLQVASPRDAFFHIRHAGAIFLGHSSPVALGDYIIGPNHVLPTSGTARYASPLSVLDFVKGSSLINVSATDLKAIAPEVQRLARLEGLEAHARSVS